MKIVFLPSVIKALVFDIDLTLYDNCAYYESQSTVLIQRLAQEVRKSVDETKRAIDAVRSRFSQANKGRQLSLGNTFLQFGISIAQSVQWREELLRPEEYLQRDPKLVETMGILAGNFKISAVTNNPTSVGIRTLHALGVERFFPLLERLAIVCTAPGFPLARE